jgi:pimeloyl-ACP methyl ester carboxylesterase
VAAVGLVDPAQKPASLDPEAVTTQAQAVFTPATGVLPSSSWFRIAMQETYDLADGTALRTPDYDATVYAYRRPAATIAPAEAVGGRVRTLGAAQPKLAATETGEGRPVAVFPLRPQVLFGPADLNEARLHVEVLPPLGGGAAALSAQGGVLESGDVRLTVPPNALNGFAAGSLRALDPAAFTALAGAGQSVVRAFELNLGGLVDGAALQLSLGTPLAPDTHFALARLVRFPGGSGLAPVQRFRTDAAGRLENTEPTTSPRLPGLTGAGQYLLVQLAVPQGLITGRVANANATSAPGIGVRLTAQPWLSVTDDAGHFALLAPAGAATALASHPTNGDGAAADFTTGESLEPITVDLTLGALAPRVLATTPPDGATKTSPVAPIVIEFSEKLAPASLGATPVALRPDGAGGDVPGGATLDLSGRLLTFLPTAPLAPGVLHTLTVSADLRDLQNLALVGPRSFSFTTAPVAARAEGAQLTIFEPGAAKVPADILAQLVGYQAGGTSSHVVAHGSPGTAEAQVPVILVNESTNATATVLSKPDGSFASFIDAEEADFVSAVFVNANGTRVTVPATKQRFDDGRTGLYRQGGILEAESDGEPVEIIVEPGAVPTRTVFTLEEVGLSEVKELLKDVEPEGGGKVLGGLRYAEQGDPITLAADVVFPLKPGDIPDGIDPAQAAFALTMPMQIDGVTSFQILDAMRFEPDGDSGRLVTRSPPFIGLLLRQITAMRREANFTDTFNRAVTIDASLTTAMVSIGTFLVPVMLGSSSGVQVSGKVLMLRHGETLTDATGTPLSGAFVRLDFIGGGSQANRPGLFRSGESFAMSERDGRFAFFMADSADRRLIATHPRFPFQRATSSGITAESAIARANLVFQQPAPVSADIEDTAAPLLSIAQSPLAASSGTSDEAGAVLTLTAADDIDAMNITIERDAFYDLTNGQPKDIARLRPPVLLDERRPSPGRLLARFRVQAEEQGSALYRIHAVDAAGNFTTATHIVAFGGPSPGGETPAARRLSSAWPPNGATGQALGTPIRFRFSRPLDPADVANASGWITVVDQGFGFQLYSAEASADRRELTVRFFVDLPPNLDASQAPPVLSLTFDPAVVNEVPGNPAGAVSVDYTVSFAQPPALTVEGAPLLSGSGAVLMGQYVYALDRNAADPTTGAGAVRVYRLTETGTLVPVQSEPLPERPADLVAIPAYALREFDGTVRSAESYLAVFTGAAQDIKRLGLYRVKPDGTLERAFNARPPIALGISQVVKAKWDPPFLAFQELGSDTTSVSLLNLNAFYIGFRLSQSQPALLATLPKNGRPGTDLNNDGDFADDGETAPLPASREGQVFGLEFSWAPLNPDERLRDFDFNADFGLLGGVFGGPAGNGLVMVLGGGAQLDETTARVLFDEDPKRLVFLPRLLLRRNGQDELRDVALVSTVANGAEPPPLLVIDVTNPSAPSRLHTAFLPAGTGSLNTIIPRDDGLLALSTTARGVVLLDPRRLLENNPDGTTAALVKDVPGLSGGGERSFTADPSGLTFTANGAALRGALDVPQIDIVTFDHVPFDTVKWKAGDVFVGEFPEFASVEDKMASVLATARRSGNGIVFPARASDPPGDLEPRNHYYALVRAPGAMGSTLELAAAAVDGAGRPTLPTQLLAAPTFLGNEELTFRFMALAAFNVLKTLPITADAAGLLDAATRAVINLSIREAFNRLILGEGEGEDDKPTKPSYATDLLAHRVSNDPTHPLFNTYLAGPIALLSEDLHPARHASLARPSGEIADQPLPHQLDRRFLAATAGFWVGLSPKLAEASLLHPFASRQDERVVFEINAGLNLETLLGSASITFNLFAPPPFGNRLLAIQRMIQFVDAQLVRSLEPGVNAYVHIGRQRNPLVFIPGIMGSELRVNGNGTKLWVDLTDAGPSLLTPSVAKLDLGPDGQPRPPGVAADASDVVGFVAGQDMAGSLIQFIGTLGYRPHKFTNFNEDGMYPSGESLKKLPEFFTFPYDWRQDNAQAAAKLADYIELIRSIHPEADNVDIVAHSMGGLVSRRYMLENPGVVGKLVLVASPLLGASKAVYSKREGDLDDFYINLIVGRSTGKNISRYMKGLDQLMPSQTFFNLGFRPVWEHGIDLNGDGFAFGPLSYADYRAFLDGSLYQAEPAPRPAPIGLNNEPFHSFPGGDRLQDDWRSDRSGTRLFHLVGVQTIPETITRVRVRPRLEEVPEEESRDVSLSLPPVDFTDTDEIIGGFPRLPEDGDAAFPVSPEAYRLGFDLELVRGAGDGTVPLLSAARGFGAEGAFDLNPDRMRVIPVVGENKTKEANKRVGHVPVLVNDITKRWIQRILTEQFQDEEVPVLGITGPPSAPEGQPITLKAEVGHRPPGVTGTPEFTWDLGDGRMLSGEEATFGFPDDGDYVVTCVARFPGGEKLTGTGGVAGLTSHVVRVTNQPPAPEITVTPASPVRGQPVRLRVNPRDPSPTDSFSYAWTTGDNPAGDFEITTAIPLLQHSFALPGTYTVTVRVRDDDGAEGVATRTIQVGEPPVAPNTLPRLANTIAPNNFFDDLNPFDDDPAGGLEYARVFVTGVHTEENLVRVDHDDRRVIGSVDGAVVRDDAGRADTNADGSVQIDLYRNTVSEVIPTRSRVTVRSLGESVRFRVEYYTGGGEARCFFHTCTTEADDDVVLELQWSTLLSLPEDAIRSMTDPTATAAGTIPGCQRTELAADTSFDDATAEVSLDMTLIDQDPVDDAATDPTPTFIDDGAPASQPDDSLDPLRDLDRRLFRKITTRRAPAATAPGGAEYVAGQGLDGNTVVSQGSGLAVKPAQLTEEKADDVRTAVQFLFAFAAAQGGDIEENPAASLFNRFVLSLDDVLILEQGTGACLWKGTAAECRGGYTPGKSDNDYELLFPTFKSGDRALNPDDPAQFESFPRIAHTDEVMQGDWYFRLPRGFKEIAVSGGGVDYEDLGPVPDFRDPAYQTYLAEVSYWAYTVPRQTTPPISLQPRFGSGAAWSGLNGIFIGNGRTLMMKKGAALFGEAPGTSPFQHAITPAQIVAYALTKSATTTSVIRRDVLTDVSFFPFRREHFLFGVMSLEKPPPFGDDPIGDAGLGRGLLLLKWVLEGAFLPPFQGFNQGVDDEFLRSQVHARLVQRSDALVPESFEWAMFHEFALLDSGVDLRVRPVDAQAATAARSRKVFGDFITEHDDKMMKKAGKAAIRAALGRLMMDPGSRAAVLFTTPQAYAEAGYASFEHFVESRVQANLEFFATSGPDDSPLEELDFKHILGAKSNDEQTFGSIRRSPGGADGFLLKCFALLNRLQRDSIGGYGSFLADLAAQGRFEERVARIQNITSIERGFQPLGASFRPGRRTLFGIDTTRPHDARWPFVVNIRNNSGESVGPLRILIDGTPACEGIALEADDRSLVIPNKERGICTSGEEVRLLTYSRSVAQRFEVRTFEVSLDGIPSALNGNTSNDALLLESEFLEMDAFLLPPEFETAARAARIEFSVESDDADITVARGEAIAALREIRADGTFGNIIPNVAFSFTDQNGATHPMPGGRLLLNQGLAREPIAWPIRVIGEAAGGAAASAPFNADITNVFQFGTTPSAAQGLFLEAVRQMNLGAFSRAPVLAPYSHAFYLQLDALNTQADLDTFLRTQTGRIFIRRNEDVFQGRTVREIVSEETPPRGMYMVGLEPGQPQTTPFAFGGSFNPGRNGKRPGGFTGDIFLERDLFERCGPLTIQSLEFRERTGTGTRTFDCLTVVKSELFHEMNVRLLDFVGERGGNVFYDVLLRGQYPRLNQAHSFLFLVGN